MFSLTKKEETSRIILIALARLANASFIFRVYSVIFYALND